MKFTGAELERQRVANEIHDLERRCSELRDVEATIRYSEEIGARIEHFEAWALSRIEHCRRQEAKFAESWTHRVLPPSGPPQGLVEAWTERRTLQAALEMLLPGRLARHDELAAKLRDGGAPR